MFNIQCRRAITFFSVSFFICMLFSMPNAYAGVSFPNNICVQALGESATDTQDNIVVSGDSSITLDCRMHASGNILLNGNSSIQGDPGSVVSATGDIQLVGNASITGANVLENTTPLADPLGNAIPPNVSGPCKTENSINNNKPTSSLTPGIYCGGLSINNSTVTFAPGVYVMRDGDFKVRGKSNLSGSGVLIYLTRSGSEESVGNVSIISQGKISLSGLMSTSLTGVLIFQDRVPSNNGNSVQNEISAAELNLQGIVYTPARSLGVSRNADVNAAVSSCIALVAKKIEFSGNMNIKANVCVFDAIPGS